MNSKTDILTAISTIITVIAILYGLWYSELHSIIKMQMPKFEADRGLKRSEIDSVLKNKAIPLLIVTAIFSILFIPESMQYIGSSAENLMSGSVCVFDPVVASIIFINMLGLYLTFVLLNMIVKIRKIKNEKGV